MPTKKLVKKKSKKTVAVDRKFLLRLANRIYNPKTKTFLRLCDGKLQNGPDPTNPKRPMHCGLGELYLAMTGKQPKETGIDEDGVIDLAVELSPLAGERQKRIDELDEKIEAMRDAIRDHKLPEDLERVLLCSFAFASGEDYVDDEKLPENDFRDALSEIPEANDDGCGDIKATNSYGEKMSACSVSDYRKRSKRVAEKLREAAKYLPR